MEDTFCHDEIDLQYAQGFRSIREVVLKAHHNSALTCACDGDHRIIDSRFTSYDVQERV